MEGAARTEVDWLSWIYGGILVCLLAGGVYWEIDLIWTSLSDPRLTVSVWWDASSVLLVAVGIATFLAGAWRIVQIVKGEAGIFHLLETVAAIQGVFWLIAMIPMAFAGWLLNMVPFSGVRYASIIPYYGLAPTLSLCCISLMDVYGDAASDGNEFLGPILGTLIALILAPIGLYVLTPIYAVLVGLLTIPLAIIGWLIGLVRAGDWGLFWPALIFVIIPLLGLFNQGGRSAASSGAELIGGILFFRKK